MSEVLRFDVKTISPEQTRKGLTRRIGELGVNQLLLIRNNEDSSEQPPSTALLTVRSEYKKGRRNSASGVWFADMAIDGMPATQAVAIKPKLPPWLVAQEFRTANEINQSSQQQLTFRPIGFVSIKAKEERHGIITKFEEDVTSFDNILHPDNGEKPDADTVTSALGCAAAALVILHGLGYEHGDYLLQNTACDSSGQPRIIDITSAEKRKRPNDFRTDPELYIGSLSRFGQIKPLATREQIIDCFLDPYRREIPNIFSNPEQRREMLSIIDCIAAMIDKRGVLMTSHRGRR